MSLYVLLIYQLSRTFFFMCINPLFDRKLEIRYMSHFGRMEICVYTYVVFLYGFLCIQARKYLPHMVEIGILAGCFYANG